jgi:hypothetical protein
MTRRAIALLPILLLCLAVRPAAHDRYRVIGPVVELDQKNNVLKMTTRDKGYPPVVEIDITAKTRIERDGRPTPRSALKRGVHVVVDALGDDVFGLEALTIRIVPAPK